MLNKFKKMTLFFIILTFICLFANPIKSSENSPKKAVVIKFIAKVNQSSVLALLTIIDQKMKEGVTDFTLLISSPGGSVPYGLTAYNYLKGIPANITTHNIGSVDSIGIILFCGGKTRLSVPHARFLIHGAGLTLRSSMRIEEPQLKEMIKGLEIDHENIAKVISTTTGKSIEEVREAILNRTVLNPEEARKWGLVNGIKSDLFPKGSEIITIGIIESNKGKKDTDPINYSSINSEAIIDTLHSNSIIDTLHNSFNYSSYPQNYIYNGSTLKTE